MSLSQSLENMRDGVRKFANVQGTTALLRHPDADINGYVNRALGSLHRKLNASLPSQRYLATTTITTSQGTSLYSLGTAFDSLISLELTADGHTYWLGQGYEMHERAALVTADAPSEGRPYTYRIMGANIELLPIPQAAYSVKVWYLPAAVQLASNTSTYDTINRLDDYVIAYASRLVAVKDKQTDLVAICKDMILELEGEIAALGRNVDRNSPPRIVDQHATDRWGRTPGQNGRRGWWR